MNNIFIISLSASYHIYIYRPGRLILTLFAGGFLMKNKPFLSMLFDRKDCLLPKICISVFDICWYISIIKSDQQRGMRREKSWILLLFWLLFSYVFQKRWQVWRLISKLCYELKCAFAGSPHRTDLIHDFWKGFDDIKKFSTEFKC